LTNSELRFFSAISDTVKILRKIELPFLAGDVQLPSQGKRAALVTCPALLSAQTEPEADFLREPETPVPSE
jgi:hypothetical protein